MVVAREGQWRVNKEEEKNNNDERGVGVVLLLRRFQSSFVVVVLVPVCVLVWLVAFVAVMTAHPRRSTLAVGEIATFTTKRPVSF